MILVFILLIIIIGFILSKINIKVEKFKLQNNLDKFSTNFNIKFIVKIYYIIPLLFIELNDGNIKFMGVKIKYVTLKENKNVNKIIYIVKKYFKISKIKYLKPDIKKINIRLCLGTESIVFTSFLVMIVSTFFSIWLKNNIRKYDNNNYHYIIRPNFEDKNIIKLDFKAIFNLKLTNIIEFMKYNLEVIK